MSSPSTQDNCACCRKPLPLGPSNRRYHGDLQGNIGRCCVKDLAIAELALAKANLHEVTHKPEHEL